MNTTLLARRTMIEVSETSARTPSRFWDRRAKAYSKKAVPDAAAYARTLERVRAHLTPSDRVLELGCGTGSTALALAPNAREILATDYSAEMIAIARAKAGQAGVGNVQFREGSFDDRALEPASFDVVMAMNLLHLLDDVPARIRRVHELVRPGGLFVSKTPCVGDQGRLLRVVIPLLQVFGIAPHLTFVTERMLASEILGAGFSLEETGMYPLKSRAFFVVARRRA